MKSRIRSLAVVAVCAGSAWLIATRQRAAQPPAAQPPAAQPPAARPGGPRPVDYGRLPRVSADANPHTKSVAEALRDQTHPERISLFARPAPFDAAAFKANPLAHLNVVEPSRVFETAQPGPGVPRLRAVGPMHFAPIQGDSVALRVAAAPAAPVTFTSFDAGAFENRLGAITVQANDAGIAEAKFTATPGTINRVHILAGSPLSAGQVRFVINVLPPATHENQAAPSRP